MAMSAALPDQEVQAAWAKLAEEIRTGVLLILRNGRPFGSHVTDVFGEYWTRAYMAHVKERYLARAPQSAIMFGFADSALCELRLQDAHLVLGFG